MFTVIVKTDSGTVSSEFSSRILISDAMEALGISHHKPCGGNGICKKCTVTANGTEVLACCTHINNNTYIEYSTAENKIQGITEGFMSDVVKNVITENGYAIAIDIGTTTVAAYIYSFPEGSCIKQIALPNPQTPYGADVVSRIEYSNRHSIEKLQSAIVSQIRELSEAYPIKKYVICGNTTMLHFLTGKNPSGIAKAPYTPQSLFGEWYGDAYLMRCISSYVGSDITSAIIACNMLNSKTSLLADIGTNGEMALSIDGRIICCSTAAGPAFEGAGISCGVYAVSGAINSVFIKGGELQYTTIDNKPPIGICGSGLIDAISCMLTLGIIDETGYLENPFEITDSSIFITPSDIRQVQLAKSAIRAGIDTLLHKCRISYPDIDNFYIAGGFGSYLNMESAAAIGLIPMELSPKAVAVGNAAGSGAKMLLLDKNLISISENITQSAETLDLTDDPFFTDSYIKNMMFQEI